ncbi:MAG: hypothetical protein ACYC2G_05205, partial [Gemmatimonadaceae bacterium]
GHAGDTHEAGDHDARDRRTGNAPHHAASAPPDGERPPSQQQHGTGQHCPASTACATPAVVEVSTTVADQTVLARTPVIVPPTTVPSSVVRGPEPPPPRA